MTLQSRDLGPAGAEACVPAPGIGGGRECSAHPSPQPDATMLSRLLKEHQAKQNERKELQGEPNIGSLSRRGLASPRAWTSSNGPDPGKGEG